MPAGIGRLSVPGQAPGARPLTHWRPPAGHAGTSPTQPGKTAGQARRGGGSHAPPLAAREAWLFLRSYRWDYCDGFSAISRLSAAMAARRLASDPPFITFCGSTPATCVSFCRRRIELGDSPGAVARVQSQLLRACASALASAHLKWHRSGCADLARAQPQARWSIHVPGTFRGFRAGRWRSPQFPAASACEAGATSGRAAPP